MVVETTRDSTKYLIGLLQIESSELIHALQKFVTPDDELTVENMIEGRNYKLSGIEDLEQNQSYLVGQPSIVLVKHGGGGTIGIVFSGSSSFVSASYGASDEVRAIANSLANELKLHRGAFYKQFSHDGSPTWVWAIWLAIAFTVYVITRSLNYAFYALVICMVGFIVMMFLQEYRTEQVTYRLSQPFFQRNKDTLFLMLISAVTGALINQLAQSFL